MNSQNSAPELCDGIDYNCDTNIDERYPDFDGDGQADCTDNDDDNDGVADEEDNDCDDNQKCDDNECVEVECENNSDCDDEEYCNEGSCEDWEIEMDVKDYSKENDTIEITWEVDAHPEVNISMTAIHYANVTHCDCELDTETAPSETGYDWISYIYYDTDSGEDFNVSIESEEIFFRAHAVIEGKHYWSEEYSIS